MSAHVGPTNITNQGHIAQVAVPTWSKHRCWHGEEVVVTALTENVKEGVEAEVRIFVKGTTVPLDNVGGLKVTDGKVTAKYKVDWKTKTLPKNAKDFVAKVVIGKLVSAESHTLRVDVEAPVFSA
jgi:hypothetical protein